jgi:DNA-binding CsgD family transcriptional regulator
MKQEATSEFAVFLFSAFAEALNADEFCKHLVHRALRRREAVGALIGVVGNDSKCHLIGQFGEWVVAKSGIFNLWGTTPVAKAIKTGQPIAIDSNDQLEATYPDADSVMPGAQSYIYIPFESTSRSIGFLGIGFAEPGRNSELDEIEIRLSTLAAQHISVATSRNQRFMTKATSSSAKAFTDEHSVNLSNRQLTILQHMAEGKTNFQIGKACNLSESTIKQESVRIYKILAVRNREDAVAKGLGQNLRALR